MLPFFYLQNDAVHRFLEHAVVAVGQSVVEEAKIS